MSVERLRTAAQVASSLFLCFGSAPLHAALLFDAPFLSIEVGRSPQAIAVGDLNADSRLDMAVANGPDDSISILLGNGDGTFESAPALATRYDPRAVAIADLNADSRPDIVVANGAFFSVSVFLGSGGGAFGPGALVEIGAEPNSIAIADWNGDEKLDLAVANGFYNTVSILLGNGDGTFRRRMDFATGREPRSIAVADLNGDSRLDLVTANRLSDDVSVLFGSGDGTFASRVDFPAGDEPTCVAIGYLDDDAYPDLAVANSIETPAVSSILLGNADGTFPMRSEHDLLETPLSVAIADVNGDAKSDLIFATQFLADHLTVVFGNGNGTFGQSKSFETGVGAQAVALGDFDENMTLDAAVAAGGSNAVCVHKGQGDGRFGSGKSFRVGSGPKFVSIADFNADAKQDLAVVNSRNYTVSIHLGAGDGAFATGTHFPTGSWPYAVAIADLNGDTRLDLVTANDGARVGPGVSVLLGEGNGSFGPKSDFGSGGGRDVNIADLNGDSIADLAVANVNDFVVTYFGRGDGSFYLSRSYPTGISPQSIFITDLNGDSRPDFVTANALGNSVTVLLAGEETVRFRRDFPTGHAPWCVDVADLNGDSQLDVVTANEGSISILLGDGAGNFEDRADLPATDSHFVAIADVDRDSNPDLVSANGLGNTVSIRLGNGDGSFGPRIDFGTGAGPSCIAIGDLNQDTGLDLAVTNFNGGTCAVLFGQVPVPITVEDFTVLMLDDRAQLTWRISAPSSHLLQGVVVERAASSPGPYEARTQSLPPTPEMFFEDPVAGTTGPLWYRLALIATDGTRTIVGPILAQRDAGYVKRLTLELARNPAWGGVHLVITVPRTGEAIVRIYDVRGHLVRYLLHGMVGSDAPATLLWDGRDRDGAPVASGIYTVLLNAAGSSCVQKIAFVR